MPYFDGGPTTLLAVVLYLALSLRKVAEDRVGAAFSYGKALKELPSGLHFLPFGLMQMRLAPRPVQQFQCPGDPEKVFKGDDTAQLPEGMVRAIRVVTGSKGPEGHSADAVLSTRMTVTLSFWVQWAVKNVLLYASNYSDEKQVEKQVRDIAEAVLAEVAVGHTPASFIDHLPTINAALVTTIGDRFENSGVSIIATRMISPDISHGVSSALAGIPIERANAAQTVIKAGAEKTRLTEEGAGRAAAELALLKAQATGRKEMMEALKVDGEAVLASEAVRGLSDKTDVLVAGAEGGMRDMMGLVKGAQSALGSSKKGGQP
ncbi:MAG: SPFH domain-containing protein [Patescibacteria group bacterium]